MAIAVVVEVAVAREVDVVTGVSGGGFVVVSFMFVLRIMRIVLRSLLYHDEAAILAIAVVVADIVVNFDVAVIAVVYIDG